MRLRSVLIPVLVGALGYGVGVTQPVWSRPALVIGQDAVSDAASAAVAVDVVDIKGPVIHIPATGQRRVALILYPGGLVRPQAYEWLGRALAADGVETWIPSMPLDLAVAAKDRAADLLPTLNGRVPVVLGGHSLGGAMAADYASRSPRTISGLLLLGAFPAEDVRIGAPWPALSVAAERDGLATVDEVRAGVTRLPEGSRLAVIPGAVHAFFGRYGPQSGDGTPTVSRSSAEAAILAEVRSYVLSRG